MLIPTLLKQVLFERTPKALTQGLFGFLVAVFLVIGLAPLKTMDQYDRVHAATTSTLNFQSRLLQANGAVVSDGFYNVEFKLYDAATSGNLLWTETRYDSNGPTAGNDNRVRVVNGYLSVSLGSVNTFPSINWDQELWLTMNIGGIAHTSTPTWDGEMSPRLKLTAVPYAFKAAEANSIKALQGSNSGTLAFNTLSGNQSILLPDASGTVCLQSSTACGFATGSGQAILQGGNTGSAFGAHMLIGTQDAYRLDLMTNSINRLQITSSGYSTFTGGTGSGVALTVNNSTSTGNILNLQDNGTDVFTVADGGAVTASGSLTVNNNVTIGAGSRLLITGGASGTRPASPSEGSVYFDTTTKQLLTYANGKWQGDRSTASYIVAASNASQSIKDKADYVATGTSDQTQINAAISAANAAGGGTVYLTEGTFAVNATITMLSNVTLVGSGKTTAITVPNGLNPATLLVISNSGTITNAEIRNLAINGNRTGQTSGTIRGVGTVTNGGTVDNVSVSNVDGGAYYVGGSTNSLFTNNVADCGYTAATAYSVHITGASNRINTNRITNCAALYSNGANNVISNNIIGVGGISSSWAIYVTGNYNTIANNNIASYTGGAIYFSAASVTVSGNVVRATGGDGINTGNSSANAVVSNNTISGISGDGMYFGSHSGLSITGNTIEGGARYGIYSIGLGHSTISGNTIRNNSMIGIYLVNVGGNVVFNTISGNTISGNTQNGIKFDGVQDSTIANNTIANNGDAATFNSRIRITNYSGTNAMRNSIVGNKISSSAASGSAILIASTSVDTYLSNNTLSGTGASSISDSSTSTTYAGQNTSSTGDLRFRTANSATAFQLQNASGVNFLIANTSASRIQIGSTTTDATAILFGLDSFNGDSTAESSLTASNGSMYYNTSMNKFRCYQNGAWADCIGSGGGGDILQGGNTFTGTDVTIGSNNAQALHLETNDTARLTISAAGTTSILGGTGSTVALAVTNGTSTGDILQLKDNGTNVLTVSDGGAVLLKNTTDSPSAFQIQSSGSTTPILNVDTTNNRVGFGTATPVQPIHFSGTHDSSTVIRIDATVNRTTAGNITGMTLTPTLNPLTANSVTGLYVNPTVVADSGETMPYYRGIDINTPTKSGTGTITDATQLFVKSPGAFATNNFGVTIEAASTQTLWLSSDTNSSNLSAGIAFGSSRDTNLYRGGSNTLKTDGALFVGSYNTGNTRLGVKGVGTTTGIALNITDSADVSRLQVLDNGTIFFGAFNCTTFTNGGKLTTDASGVLSCANDTGGGSGVTNVGALNGGTANANGATISGTDIYLQSASASYAGLVDTGTQTFAGNKTFSGATVFQTSTNSVTGFQILDQDGGAPVLNVDTVNERLGVGTAAPSAKLHVSSDGTTPATSLYSSSTDVLFSKSGNQVNIGLAASNTDFHKVVFAGNRARGTLDTPLAVVAGDAIASFQGSGFDGTTMYTSAGMNFYVDGTVSTGSVPLGIIFETGTTNANRAARLTITSGGNIRVGTVDATGSLLVLDTKNNDTTDPSGVDGGMYYNSSAGKLRCHQNSAWTDCVSSLQSAYDNGNTVTATDGRNVVFNMADTTTDPKFIVNLQQSYAGGFEIQASGSTFFRAQDQGANGTVAVLSTDSYAFLVQNSQYNYDVLRVDAGNSHTYLTGSLTQSAGTISLMGNGNSFIRTNAGDLTIGPTANSSILFLGTGDNNKTVNIGAVGTTANTTTINLATTTGAATQTVNIGSDSSASLLNMKAGTGGVSISSSAGILLSAANSTTALRVVNASGQDYLTVSTDSGSRLVRVGSGSDNVLLSLDQFAASGAPAAVAGAMYYDTTDSKFKCAQGSPVAWVDCVSTGAGASTKRITLVPEFNGGTLYGDGTNNTGSMTASYIGGLSSGQGYKHNYYQWTSTSGTLQDYSIMINYQLPSDFSAFTASSFKIWGYGNSNSTANNDLNILIRDADGTICMASESFLPATAATWVQKVLTTPTNNGTTCTFAADDIITIEVMTFSRSSNMVRLGEMTFQYTTP